MVKTYTVLFFLPIFPSLLEVAYGIHINAKLIFRDHVREPIAERNIIKIVLHRDVILLEVSISQNCTSVLPPAEYEVDQPPYVKVKTILTDPCLRANHLVN